jgi:hypothetical protein
MPGQYCVQVRLSLTATNKLVVLQLALAGFCRNKRKGWASIGRHVVLKKKMVNMWGCCDVAPFIHFQFLVKVSQIQFQK